PVHGEEGRAAAAEVGDRAPHRLGNVIELEVGEHLVAACGEPAQQLEIAVGGEQLQADLVEAHRIAQLLGERARLLRRGHVEGDDQALGARDHFFSFIEYSFRLSARSAGSMCQVSASNEYALSIWDRRSSAASRASTQPSRSV